MTESTTLATIDLRLPGGISVLLISYEDGLAEAVKRVERAIQSGEGEDAFFVVFLGSGVWDFQLLYTVLLLLIYGVSKI